jgi:hypothetical protein
MSIDFLKNKTYQQALFLRETRLRGIKNLSGTRSGILMENGIEAMSPQAQTCRVCL